MSDSVLYLDLPNSSGSVTINSQIPQNKILRLSKVCITWDSTGDSTNAGSSISVDLGFFNHTKINSNKSVNISALPLINDITKSVTFYTLELPLSVIDDISQSFSYTIRTRTGALVTNLTNLQLIFAYKN